jgi:hypothetical protein
MSNALPLDRMQAYARLAEFLPRAMEDGVLDDSEKAELLGIFGTNLLTPQDVREIFLAHLRGMAADVMADGIIEKHEQEWCLRAIAQLRIPSSFIPDELAAIIGTPV